MKFSSLFKKNISHAILLGVISQLCGTFALAAQQPNKNNRGQYTAADYTEPQKNILESLILEYVQQADTTEDAPSQAVMRCYQQILSGNDTLVLKDVLAAMPELVNFAVLQHEKKATLSQKETTFDSFNEKYSQSKLANRCLPDFGFYNWMCELNTIMKNLEKCCKETRSDFKQTWSVIEECCDDIIERVNTCCGQTQNNFEYTWSVINEVENTVAECCEQTQNNFQTTFNLLNTLLQQSCEDTCWKLAVNETGASLNNFTQTDGVWTTDGDHITTTATPYLINALKYNFPVQQTYQVLQVEIAFPNSQPPNVTNAVVGGLLFDWTGSDETVAGPLTCYLDFNTDSDGQVVPGTSNVSLEVFRNGGGAGSIAYPISLDTYYQLTVVMSPYNLMSVYINDMLVAQTNYGSSWSGQVLGCYVGFWAAFGTVNFRNLKSWTALPFFL